MDAAGVNRRLIAEQAVAILLREVFVHGFFHADPHPGNFFVLEDERSGLMDFGMVGRLDESTKTSLLRIAVAVTRRDTDRLVDALMAAGMAGDIGTRAALKRDLSRLLGRYLDHPIKEIAARQFVHEVLTVARRHRLQMPTDFVQLAKVIAVSEGLGAQLDPEFKLFEFAAPYFQRFWLDGRSPLTMGRRLATEVLDLAELSVGLPRRAERLLTQLEHDGLQTTSRLEGLEPALRELSQIGNRLSLSILTAALIIGLGLLMQFYHPPLWNSVVGVLFFAVSLATAGLGGWLFWSMARGR